MKALIVDDSLETVSSVRLILQREGWSVEGAFDGEDGVRRAMMNQYDLFLVDFRMPRVGGLEFARRVVRHRSLANVPIVFIAADPSPGDRTRALELGARDIIPKPFGPKELLLRIRRVFEQISLEQQDDRISDAMETGMSGRLGDVSTVDLIQIYHLGRKPGTLVVRSGLEKARIFFRNGEACSAHIERDGYHVNRGVEAIHAMMRWLEGDFALDFIPPEVVPNIDTPTERILIEGMRRIDESSRTPQLY